MSARLLWLMANGEWLKCPGQPRRLAISHSAMSPDKLPEHVRQDAAVLKRDELLRRVDARRSPEFDGLAAIGVGANGDDAAGAKILRKTRRVVLLATRQSQRRGILAALKLHRQHAHVHEVAAMDAFEALRDHDFHTEQERP